MNDTSIPITHSSRHEMSLQEHIVQFSETDTSLLTSVFAFIDSGWSAGDACIVVATQSHRESLIQLMQAGGRDIVTAQKQSYSFFLDAAATLAQFMVDGEPDPVRF